MAPEGEEYPTDPGGDDDSGGPDIQDLALDVPEGVRPEQYIRGYADGFEAGFDAALEWIERQSGSQNSRNSAKASAILNSAGELFED